MTAVVILNWNGAAMLRRFLPTVVRHTAGADIIVADNASTDNSLQVLREEFAGVRIITLPQNYGFAEGYNKAFEALRDEGYTHYVLLNSDVEVTPGWLSPLTACLDAHPDVAACQPKVLAHYAPERFEYAGAAGGYIDRDGYPFCRGRLFGHVERDEGQYDQSADIFWATGAALVIRREEWEGAGGLDGRFFAHNEEIDLCWRLRSRGRRIVCVPESVVLHVGGGTLPKDNPRKTYLNFRNNLLMLYKNLPEDRLASVMRRRRWLDAVAWCRFAFTGDWGNAKAIRRARRDYRRMRADFARERAENLRLTTVTHIAEIYDHSLLSAYYLRRKRTFSALNF